MMHAHNNVNIMKGTGNIILCLSSNIGTQFWHDLNLFQKNNDVMDRWTDTNKLFCILLFRLDNFFYWTVQPKRFFKFLFIELPVGSTAVSFLLTDNLLQVEMVDFSIFLHLVFFLYQSLYQHVPEIKVVRSVFFELVYNCLVSVRGQRVYSWYLLILVLE